MIYQGSCHCGQVRFEVEGELERVIDCNCSFCSRKGALLWFVPRDKLTLLTPEENLADYRFGPATIRYRFCKVCGIHPLGRRHRFDRQAHGGDQCALSGKRRFCHSTGRPLRRSGTLTRAVEI